MNDKNCFTRKIEEIMENTESEKKTGNEFQGADKRKTNHDQRRIFIQIQADYGRLSCSINWDVSLLPSLETKHPS